MIYFPTTRSIICVLAYKCTLCRCEMISDPLDEDKDESVFSGASARSSIPSTPWQLGVSPPCGVSCPSGTYTEFGLPTLPGTPAFGSDIGPNGLPPPSPPAVAAVIRGCLKDPRFAVS